MTQLSSIIGTSDLRAIPFAYEVQDADWTSYYEVQGLIRLDGPILVIELQHQLHKFNENLGDYKAKKSPAPTTLQLPLADIEQLQVVRRWFSAVLHLQVKRLALLSGIPGAKASEVKLKIARKLVRDAQALASRAMLIRSELLANN